MVAFINYKIKTIFFDSDSISTCMCGNPKAWKSSCVIKPMELEKCVSLSYQYELMKVKNRAMDIHWILKRESGHGQEGQQKIINQTRIFILLLWISWLKASPSDDKTTYSVGKRSNAGVGANIRATRHDILRMFWTIFWIGEGRKSFMEDRSTQLSANKSNKILCSHLSS